MKTTISHGIILVGDAARQSDPLTGGGIINAMRAGVLAGEVAAEAISAGDVSREMLEIYEERWRCSFGKLIEQGYDAKKFFLDLTDEDMNRLIESLQGQDISRIKTPGFLKILLRQNPNLIWSLRHLIA